jgi:hypothetical protein
VQVQVLAAENHVALANPIGAADSTMSTGNDAVVLDRDLRQVHGDLVCRALVRDGSPSAS